MRLRSSLRFKFLSTFIILETIFILGIVAFSLYNLKHESDLLLKEKTHLASALFNDVVATPLLVNDLASIDESIASFVGNDDVVHVRVNDTIGRVLSEALSQNPLYQTGRIKQELSDLMTKPATAHDTLFNISDQFFMQVRDEIAIDGKVLGFIRITYNVTRHMHALSLNRLYTGAMAAAAIFISTIIALLTGFRIAASIEQLSHVTSDIAHDRLVEIPHYKKTGDEICQLYESVQLMQRNIQTRTDELMLERERALAASKAKSDFLAVMSHEIRTPINGMIGSLSLIDLSKLTEDDAEQIRTALMSSELLLAVINDILDYSKIEAGQFSIDLQPMSIYVLVREVEKIYRPLAEKKGLLFDLDVSGVQDVYAFGDRIRIKQILSNFLNNALKFTDSGSIRLYAFQNAHGHIAFSVNDTGIGIRKEDLGKLFKDFSQVDTSTSRKYGGTGLGLVISKKLAELMNGTTYVSSEYGQGSSFGFTLDLERTTRTIYDVTHPSLAQAAPLETPSIAANVLLVEDNLINQKVATRMLEKIGCHTVLATNGQEALDLFHLDQFDIILMDCQMPVMDGLAATRLIRQHDKQIPIVALTANAQDSDRHACLEAGMSSFLSKPFRPQELYAVMNEQLRPANNPANNKAQQLEALTS